MCGGADGAGDVKPGLLPGGAEGCDTREGGGAGGNPAPAVGAGIEAESERGRAEGVFSLRVAEESVRGLVVGVVLGLGKEPELSRPGRGSSEDFAFSEPETVEGGGASGASYESTVICVVAGLRGAPSGPMNLTFFLSPSEGDVRPVGVMGRAVDAVEGPLKSKCLSPSPISGNPGVATVDQAPLSDFWGVRVEVVSILGRLALEVDAGDRSVGVDPEGDVG